MSQSDTIALMAKIAVVSGGGTGVGRAVVIELANRGYAVALLGRTQSTLDETVKLASSKGSRLLPIRCDVADEAAVAAMAEFVREELGDPSVLVNCAGTNIVGRALTDLTTEDYR